MRQPVIVLDGHDAAGKTTLAARLAEELGGLHVRPFAGTAGQLMLWSARQGNFAFTSDLARQAVAYTLAENTAPVLVFDRHWMTVFSLLPESYWPAWEPLPPTVLCWANLETTLSRLAARGDVEMQLEEHLHYLSVYRDMAERFGCHILQTDQLTIAEATKMLIERVKRFL
jgi:deoxyadenosine/deoxycytidine kinase